MERRSRLTRALWTITAVATAVWLLLVLTISLPTAASLFRTSQADPPPAIRLEGIASSAVETVAMEPAESANTTSTETVAPPEATATDVEPTPAARQLQVAAQASGPPISGPVGNLRLASAGINAPVVLGQVDASGTMIAPNGPQAVAWYSYSARPGAGGNAVFSGHVDWVGVGAAAFWGLRNAGIGDIIEVSFSGQPTLRYAVAFNRTYDSEDGPWETLFNSGAGRDVITLYTCDGTFRNGDYNQRRVVRATRIG